jgi:hypothetical protein
MDRLRRDRAAAQVLRAAFPTVQQLRIQLKFEGAGVTTPTAQAHVLYPPARAFFEYPCPYSDCDGQFDLGSAVAVALAQASHATEGVLECCGLRARDHASKQPCLLHLVYEVTATCREKT